MTNIIFLDIDGCLNHGFFGDSEQTKFGFDPKLVSNLKFILDSVDNCKIVISSSWRHFEIASNIDKTRPWVEILEEQLGYPGCIIGKTPTIYDSGKTRADEIKAWLDENREQYQINCFVIIDDECSCFKQTFSNNYVDCEILSGKGLDEQNAKVAIWILTNNNRDKIPQNQEIWFTSDTHFFHGNIIKYCSRPWHSLDKDGNIKVTDDDIQEMNNTIIKNWNSVVKKNDIVYHLGDFSFGNKEHIKEILPKLHGDIRIVLGNHDRHKYSYYLECGFSHVYDKPILLHGFYLLSHEPMQWLSKNSPLINIYGHVHNSTIYDTVTKNTVCVCTERWNYTPVSFMEIKNKLKEKQ